MSKEVTQHMRGILPSFDEGLKRAFEVNDTVPLELQTAEAVKMNATKLKVSGDGVFYTLQGEGPTTGEPATFVRLQVCNLACGWCDAWYTWNPKSTEFWTEGRDVEIPDIAKKVEDSWLSENPAKAKRVVVTGGEPLIQKRQIDILMDQLPDWQVEIETNGTIMPTEKQLEKAQFNCSPKLRNSGNSEKSRIRPKVLQRLNEANTTFKFVVMENEDLDEIQTDFIDRVGLDPNKVILMPQGVTAEEVQVNMQVVAEYAKQKGFRLMGRLQNEIWGARRGV